jgi:hypothetical protein
MRTGKEPETNFRSFIQSDLGLFSFTKEECCLKLREMLGSKRD